MASGGEKFSCMARVDGEEKGRFSPTEKIAGRRKQFVEPSPGTNQAAADEEPPRKVA